MQFQALQVRMAELEQETQALCQAYVCLEPQGGALSQTQRSKEVQHRD